MTRSNVPAVQGIYEAFGRGDIPAVLELLAAEVRWEHWDVPNSAQEAGHPLFLRRTGRDEVAGYFEALQGFEIHSYEPVSFLEGEEKVAVLVRLDMTVKKTGRRLQEEGIHLWTLGPDDQVTDFRHYFDTAKQISAYRA
jgi:uncharacterized protein